jgi:AcrR family transcriptional regulator
MTRDRHDGTKRAEILAAATQRFGRDGYEHTKWADVASDVGIGPTALYHYFESKQHCLYVIMDEAIGDFQRRFTAITSETPDPLAALAAVLYDCFDLTEQDIMRNRVLVSEQGLLGVRRPSPREEEARRAARSRARELEFAWASHHAGAMRAGALPKSDPRLLSRALLGLYNSVWQWYRPDGIHGLRSIADFFHGRALAMIGIGPEGATRTKMVA